MDFSLRKFLALRLGPLVVAGTALIFILTSITFNQFVEKIYFEKIRLANSLFVQNIKTDILLGAFHQVDQKCEAFFKSTEMLSLKITDSKKTLICNLRNDDLEIPGLLVTESIYFGEDDKNTAAHIENEYSLERLLNYKTNVILGVSLVGLIVLLLSVIFIFHTTNRITIPIERLVQSFQAENLDFIAKLDSPKGIFEISILYSSVRNLATQILRSNEREAESIKLETFSTVAKQVSHDIRSPLAALTMILDNINQISEDRRLIIRNSVNRINDIANTLLTQSKRVGLMNRAEGEPLISENLDIVLCPELIPALVDLLVSEKRVQFRNQSNVQINLNLRNSYGAFAIIDSTELKRVLSNLINNSAEALSEFGGTIDVSVRLESKFVQILIQDNGKGIPEHVLNKLGQIEVTHGKEGSNSGSGIGVYHAKKTIESFNGTFEITSRVGEGTKVIILLKKTDTPEWFVEKLKISSNRTIVVVDDDSSIHQIWHGRLKSLNTNTPVLSFTSGTEFKNWYLSNKGLPLLFLVDFELLGQSQTGLDLIAELGISSQSILVTSRYEEPPIRKRTKSLGVKLLPKGMAGFIPIEILNEKPKQRFDALLIDDDSLVHMAWSISAKDHQKEIRCFVSFEQFCKEVESVDTTSPVYIDANLGNNIRGEDVAEQVFGLGFRTIIIATGYDPESINTNPFITRVAGKDPPFC